MHLERRASVSRTLEPGSPGLFRAFEQAREQALRRGEPVVLRTQLPLGRIDPWQVWQAAERLAGPVGMAWADPSVSASWVAAGELLAFHPPTLDGLADLCSAIAEKVIDGSSPPDEAAPLFVGGFSFDPATAEQRGDWRDWPATQLVLPRLLVWQAGGETFAGWSRLVDHSSTFAQLELELGRLSELTRCDGSGIPPPVPSVPEQQPDERARFVALVAQARDAVMAGSLEKLVVARARRFHSLGGHHDPEAVARRLRASEPQAFSFFLRGPRETAFVGATPELLVRVHRGQVETIALAGTAPRGATEAEDRARAAALLDSAKDREEQAIVTERILAVLLPSLASCLPVAEPTLVRHRRVQHLATPIRGTLREGESLLSIAKRLHPTPAVAGAPVDRARAWLRAHEALERGWYAGAVGHLDRKGDGTLVVALRSALLTSGDALAYAGAGIVRDSDPEREWSETELKLTAIAEALGAPPLEDA